MENRSSRGRRVTLILLVVGMAAGAFFYIREQQPVVEQDVTPTETIVDSDPSLARTRVSSIAEVIEIAEAALQSMGSSLEDYTALFIKQERDSAGNLSERTEMDIKIQTRLRNDANDAPMRIYLKFLAPEATAGREVIWGKDLYDAQMAVHDTSLMLSWKTLWLEPTGMLAMTGQRFPVYEIGLTRLVEKLIERGQQDLNNPDVTVTITRDHPYDDRMCELIQATRAKPSGRETDDFSLAEIVYDPERSLVLSYRSFGWPEAGSSDVPLLESYEYHDVKTNVGLSDSDFDVKNDAYSFP